MKAIIDSICTIYGMFVLAGMMAFISIFSSIGFNLLNSWALGAALFIHIAGFIYSVFIKKTDIDKYVKFLAFSFGLPLLFTVLLGFITAMASIADGDIPKSKFDDFNCFLPALISLLILVASVIPPLIQNSNSVQLS